MSRRVSAHSKLWLRNGGLVWNRCLHSSQCAVCGGVVSSRRAWRSGEQEDSALGKNEEEGEYRDTRGIGHEEQTHHAEQSIGRAGVYVGIVDDAMKRALTADLLPLDRRGVGYGALATANSFGDLLPSILVGSYGLTCQSPRDSATAPYSPCWARFSCFGSYSSPRS